jgi:hypothetical protein
MPTRDTHLLMDEEASVDKALPMHFTKGPQVITPQAKPQGKPQGKALGKLKVTLKVNLKVKVY